MENKKDGGPAFPTVPTSNLSPDGIGYFIEEKPGMSLRDYFAAHVDVERMVTQYLRATNNFTPEFKDIIDLTAEAKYKLADAMLKERQNAK